MTVELIECDLSEIADRSLRRKVADMSEHLYYPINDFGPLMKGLVIGGLAITHVFLAMFAIGGGMLMCYFQWLSQDGRCRHTRRFIDGYFRVLVLISFVIGAVTGVALSVPTSAVSSAENRNGTVFSIRPSATFFPLTEIVPLPPEPGLSPS